METRGSFTEAVEKFIEAADWLGPVDEPAIHSLRALAGELDWHGVKAALIAQYGLTYRNLLAKAPTSDDGDELAAALKEAQAG